MFSVQSGWLRYAPFAHFQLPEVIQVYDYEEGRETPVKVPFCDKSGNVKFTRNLYKLQWPGQLSQGALPKAGQWDMIPGEILGNLGIDTAVLLRDNVVKQKQFIDDGLAISLKEIVDQISEVLPASMAYHLAVNADTYFPGPGMIQDRYPHSVGALNAERLVQVLDVRFALDAEAVSALRYLKWVAEGHRQHPLLTGFDTMIREHLMALCEVTVQLYFGLLQDYLYDSYTHYWVKEDWKAHWWQLAGYLFWLGRTGDARVTDHAGIDPIWQNSIKRFHEVCPDVSTGLEQWRSLDYGRKLARVDGKDPCIADDPIGSVLP